ncbi:MAG TPA: YfhO family protein, partial [Geobacteraceae bacterium]|nr:YfhO family protein [Geobacteraceae bacterium]
VAVVETPPPINLEPAGSTTAPAGEVVLQSYAGEQLSFRATVTKNALLVTGEKYANGWKAMVDGKPAPLVRANYVLRGVYLTPGTHEVRFLFDPLSFKLGKWLTLGSFALFAVMLGLEFRKWRRREAVRNE